jgi:site-specific recombinase XerD
MELLSQFSQYLIAQKRTPSRATLKNYTADIRRFIRWYEMRLKQPFTPDHVTGQLLAEFKRSQVESPSDTASSFAPASASSVERYMSSLRKFFLFLTDEHIISSNPFDLLTEAKSAQKEADPWQQGSFKNYLYSEKASPLTIKNYLLDLKQFSTWLTTAAGENNHYSLKDRNLLSHITPLLLEEYKQRLLTDAKVSPSTINRKLSSLRRYITWAQSQGIIEAFQPAELPVNISDKPNEVL